MSVGVFLCSWFSFVFVIIFVVLVSACFFFFFFRLLNIYRLEVVHLFFYLQTFSFLWVSVVLLSFPFFSLKHFFLCCFRNKCRQSFHTKLWRSLVITGKDSTNCVSGSRLCTAQVRAQLRWPQAQNPEVWSYFSPTSEMKCILVCPADIQRGLRVPFLPPSPPLWANTAGLSLSITLQHMMLTPISPLRNVVAHKTDISSRGCDCTQRR